MIEIEKNWCVEVWGNWGEYTTELFHTKREAEKYFKSIRKSLDSSKYLFAKNSIVSIANEDDSIHITNLKEDLV